MKRSQGTDGLSFLNSRIRKLLRVIFTELRFHDLDQQLHPAFNTLVASKARYLDVIVFKDIDFDAFADDSGYYC